MLAGLEVEALIWPRFLLFDGVSFIRETGPDGVECFSVSGVYACSGDGDR